MESRDIRQSFAAAPLNCDKAVFAQLTDLRQNVMVVIILVTAVSHLTDYAQISC